MKPRRHLYGIHNDFSAVAGGLRRGCILIRNRDGVGRAITFLDVAHMVDAHMVNPKKTLPLATF